MGCQRNAATIAAFIVGIVCIVACLIIIVFLCCSACKSDDEGKILRLEFVLANTRLSYAPGGWLVGPLAQGNYRVYGRSLASIPANIPLGFPEVNGHGRWDADGDGEEHP
jgi:hypothetical protein